jgi:DeoR/GlpR family transcriptional regulator of sugar metabolism
MAIKIGVTTERIAKALRNGGRYNYAALCKDLKMHRETLNRGLAMLEDLGAIEYTHGRAGRPKRGQVGGGLDVVVFENSWVWEALGL